MTANETLKVINASAGLLTVKDLTIPSAAIEDMRKYFLI
jgi:hypothetical protein